MLITSMYAASFNCKKASTFIEHTICNDTELSKLDEELASSYKKVWNSLSDKTDLKKDQFDWLKNTRDKCMSLECLKTTYTDRVLYLTNYDSKDSQVNRAVDFNDILGVYTKDEASIKVNQDLSFEYISVNELTANTCSIENEKFKVENGNLVWNSQEADCKIQVSKSNKNNINFSSSGEGCFSYCGVSAYFVNGIYQKEKNIVKQQTVNVNEPVTEKEKSETKQLTFKDFYLGMDKSDIPSQIELVKGAKMSDYDDSFQYEDKNNNLIKIDDFEFTVKFVIRGDNNKVKSIWYNAKNINKDIAESQLVELSKKLTDKPLKKRTMNSYVNNELSNIILEYSEIKNGVEDDFRFIYSNDNATSSKNEITVILSLTDKKKSDEETEKRGNDMFITVQRGAFLCSSDNSYKRLIDYSIKKSNSYIPSDCFQTEKGKFMKTVDNDSYNGVTIIKVMGANNRYFWVMESFTE